MTFFIPEFWCGVITGAVFLVVLVLIWAKVTGQE